MVRKPDSPKRQKDRTPLPERRAMRCKAAAEYISVSPQTIRTLVQRGELAVVRICEGDRSPWLVDRNDLDALVERRKGTL